MAVLVLVLFLFFCAIICPSAPGILATASCPYNHDASALLAFRNAIISDPRHLLSAWKLPLTNCSSASACSWKGVSCDESHRVAALQLNGSFLRGTVSPSLAQLPFLRSLDLSSNNLSGGIPVELGRLRASLISLDLSQNQLSGRIPVELGMLNKLQFLYLWMNELTGAVPAALANCTALVHLNLENNYLSESIPMELGMLYKLELLHLSENELTGAMPATLANCTALRELQLNSNQLSGSIPMEWGMLNKLRRLKLVSNELTGGVPVALANCTALWDLELTLNKLSGSIPVELGMLNNLEILSLWENELTGGVPAALANCTSLTILDLNMNQLSGSIPVELGLLKELERLYLSLNKLTGGVPAALANCSSLRVLDLAFNRLSGRIPKELGMLNKLAILYLLENELMGEMPASLANCTALTSLALFSNQLSGNVPDVFYTLSSLAGLYLSHNFFGGIIPRSLTRLQQLTWVSLGGNALVGTIPKFTSLQLNHLMVFNNNLSGSIPESLGTLQGLVYVDLSYNLLSGQVPVSLGLLKQLNVLNLSNNEFSGSIPSALGSCAQLQILNLSHNKLTGKLPSSFASLGSLAKLDLSYNQLEGLVPNIFPFNQTKLVDLRENPMLRGPILNCSCNASNQGSLRRAPPNMKWIVPLAVAIGLAGLLLFGIVIWQHRNLVGSATNIHDSFRCISDVFVRKQLKVSAEELREATDDFSEANILGRGGVSTVYRAVLADVTQKVVAVKVLRTELLTRVSTDAEVARLKQEVQLLAMVRHRNIVRALGCCFNLDIQAVILELIPNGNLDTYLHGMQRQEAVTEEEKVRLLYGIAQGLEYLHHWHDPGKTIVHCDVKPANILLDEDWEPRIADFGIAKLLEHGDEVLQQSASILLRGSVGYIPPEYAFCTQASSAGDVYSFGVVMLEILTGKRPTEVGGSGSDGEQQTLMSLVQAAVPNQLLGLFETPGMTEDEAIALSQLALSCTSLTPSQRPTMLQVSSALTKLQPPSPATLLK